MLAAAIKDNTQGNKQDYKITTLKTQTKHRNNQLTFLTTTLTATKQNRLSTELNQLINSRINIIINNLNTTLAL